MRTWRKCALRCSAWTSRRPARRSSRRSATRATRAATRSSSPCSPSGSATEFPETERKNGGLGRRFHFTELRSNARPCTVPARSRRRAARDRKSTRLNSSHVEISYAVFCLKKKKNKQDTFLVKKKKKK